MELCLSLQSLLPQKKITLFDGDISAFKMELRKQVGSALPLVLLSLLTTTSTTITTAAAS